MHINAMSIHKGVKQLRSKKVILVNSIIWPMPRKVQSINHLRWGDIVCN